MKPPSFLRIRLLAAVFLWAARAAAAGAADPPAGKTFETVKVAEGIYAFISPVSSTGIVTGNSTLIAGDDGALVVDSGRFPTLTRRMIAEIRKRTSQPVRYLAHTHWHADHVLTDHEFQKAFPGLSIIATGFTREKVGVNAPKDLRETAANVPAILEGMRAQLAGGKRRDGSPLSEEERGSLETLIPDVETMVSEMAMIEKVVLPDLTFEGKATIYLGKREVRLAFLGRGNTAGDTVVHVPDSQVLVAGDLLVLPTPFGHGSYPGEWIETLRKLMTLDAAAIVPGHGPVQRDWTYAKRLLALLESLRAQVGEAVRQGASLPEARQRVDLAVFERQFAGEDAGRRNAFRAFFVAPAVERAYQEATGAFSEEGSVPPK